MIRMKVEEHLDECGNCSDYRRESPLEQLLLSAASLDQSLRSVHTCVTDVQECSFTHITGLCLLVFTRRASLGCRNGSSEESLDVAQEG